jgi:peptidoglycan/xylan/chitin deacetylase (PgdA/CDA1 family)
MERRRFLALGATAALLLGGCARLLRPEEAAAPEPPDEASAAREEPSDEPPSASEETTDIEETDVEQGREPPADEGAPPVTEETTEPAEPEIDAELLEATPSEWGEAVTGVGTRLADTSAIALTFDACGGPNGSRYDATLIDHLRQHEVPATLFMNARWVEANPEVFAELADDPLFEIENHGTEHRPLSVDGRGVYGIDGTASAEDAVEEVLGCQRLLTELTGDAPRFFRSGTAYYDDVAVRIVHALGLEVAGYSVLGDAGATFTAPQVRDALLGAAPGSIVLLHLNHPGSGTADGVAAALPSLLAGGATFTTLGRHPLL